MSLIPENATPAPSCAPDGAGGEICETKARTFLGWAAVAAHAQEEANGCWAACLEMDFSCQTY